MTKLDTLFNYLVGVFISSIFAIFSFGLQCSPRICRRFCPMPVMNDHVYQDDFRRALSNIVPRISSPTVTIELPSIESTDQIQIRQHMEAPVAEAIAQNIVPPIQTRTNDLCDDSYQQVEQVRPITTN